MSTVQIFRNRESGEIVLVPFALDRDLGGGDRAAGPMTRLSLDEFLNEGLRHVQEHLDAFYTRDFRCKSELYQMMSAAERKKFFQSHDRMVITVPKARDSAKIYLGYDLHEVVPYPFHESFAEHILNTFADAFGKTPN